MATRPPLLFLDIDGVLHPASAHASTPFSRAPILAQALHGFDVRIIVSSSWRFSHSLRELKSLLPPPISDLCDGVTGDAAFREHARYHEILAFMAEAGECGPWRALDDTALEFPKHCKELILCNPAIGIEDAQVDALRHWLRGQCEGS